MPPAGSNRHRFGLLARGVFGLSTATALSGLIWLGWTGAGTREAMRAASIRAVHVAELRGTIDYLDEWLTMSAEMGASSGAPSWAARFEEAAPKLDAAIAEAADLATPEARAALDSTIGEAHRDLVTMERRAFTLVAAGDLAAAQALLHGPEFVYLKDVYASGMDVFGEELKTLAHRRAADLNDRAWLEAAGLGLSAIFLITTALMVRGRSRMKGAMDRIATIARIDALTNLPNRRHFYDALALGLAENNGSEARLALLLLDIDRFKAANDAHGHPAGDTLLQLVAVRLSGIVRTQTLVARLGGDEFALILTLHGGPQALAEVSAVAKRIVAVMAEPFLLAASMTVQLGASVGIAVAGPEEANAADLMHQADVALHRAKADGRGCFRFFEPGMDAHVRSRAILEGELRQAIADDAIVPHFQPLVDLASGCLSGVEMLARWPHPTRGMVSPVEFIPIAEEVGLIGLMTERLLRQACRAAVCWPPHVTLACNVSPVQLRDPSLPAMIRAILDETAFPACRLEIEVTETALVGDLDLARGLLDQLKALGVRLALDDFGTGYSSLRHLQTLPFDKIKIDRSFVGAMAVDPESGKIVSAVVGLGHSLGLSTVAEGVETTETARCLRELGCDIGQGWLFGKPQPADRIDALFREAQPDSGPVSWAA